MWNFSWFTLFPKAFIYLFLKGYSFFSKKVFFVFYWIVNLDSLVLTCVYTILLQTFIRFDLVNICFLPLDTTLDYISQRSVFKYCCHTKHVKQRLKAVNYFGKKHQFRCLSPIGTIFRKSFNEVSPFYFFLLDINFEIFLYWICGKISEILIGKLSVLQFPQN